MPVPPEPTLPARPVVVLLCGPSGAGKSRLAGRLHDRHGWPVVALDNFYRDIDDPGLPRHPTLGIADWDDPASWDAEGAAAAIGELAASGRAGIPVYDIATSRRVGSTDVTARPTDLLVGEGIFAAELTGRLRREGLLHSAWCVRDNRVLTMARRFRRDLAEGRKPPLVLARRGWALMRAEPGIVARAEALGARAITQRALAAALEPAAPPGRRPAGSVTA
jgi:uridine kinase